MSKPKPKGIRRIYKDKGPGPRSSTGHASYALREANGSVYSGNLDINYFESRVSRGLTFKGIKPQ